MSTFSLRLPDDLKALGASAAQELGISENQLYVTAIAERLGAQAEARAYFKARAGRAITGRAREILGRAGTEEPRSDDRLDPASTDIGGC